MCFYVKLFVYIFNAWRIEKDISDWFGLLVLKYSTVFHCLQGGPQSLPEMTALVWEKNSFETSKIINVLKI